MPHWQKVVSFSSFPVVRRFHIHTSECFRNTITSLINKKLCQKSSASPRMKPYSKINQGATHLLYQLHLYVLYISKKLGHLNKNFLNIYTLPTHPWWLLAYSEQFLFYLPRYSGLCHWDFCCLGWRHVKHWKITLEKLKRQSVLFYLSITIHSLLRLTRGKLWCTRWMYTYMINTFIFIIKLNAYKDTGYHFLSAAEV